MIEVKNLSYAVGAKKILNKVNFKIRDGEMLSILGANGAGKSTLLKLLCKEMKPATGCILLNDIDINLYSLKELAKMRAVLMQQNTLSLMFTVKELVLMGRYPHFENIPSTHDLDIINEVLKETGITHLTNRNYHTLSGGEQQRVQLARVIAQIYDQPKGYLFLDEPTNGLDLLYQQQILQLAKNMAQKGYTVISILHDINFASRYSDKILLLKNGEVINFGIPSEVINCENIYQAYQVKVKLINHEDFECPLVVTTEVLI